MTNGTSAHAVVLADGTVQTPCENPCCGLGYWSNHTSQHGTRRQMVDQPTTGRRRLFCSDACKQQVYRHRKELTDRAAAERAAVMRDLERQNQARGVILHALADFVGTSRGPGQRKFTEVAAKAAAEQIVRMLKLADLLS